MKFKNKKAGYDFKLYCAFASISYFQRFLLFEICPAFTSVFLTSCDMKKENPFARMSGAHVSGLVGTPDTISETGSMKSRSRRTLPYLPPEEPAPLPTQAKKAQERMRWLKFNQDWADLLFKNSFYRAFANTRQSSLDGLTGRGGAFSSASKPRPSSSETNLRKLAAGDGMARPGSALGLLQGNKAPKFKGHQRNLTIWKVFCQ